MKDREQNLWLWNCCLQPQHLIPSSMRGVPNKLMQLLGGLDLIPTPCPSTPTSPLPLWMSAVDMAPSVVCYLSLSLSLSLPIFSTCSIPPPLLPYLWGERGRVANSQRQTAHPSITPARSLWRWALSSTTQLLPSIKMYRWTRMHTHRRLSQTLLSGWMYPCQFTHICNAWRKAHIRLHAWDNRCTFTLITQQREDRWPSFLCTHKWRRRQAFGFVYMR